MKKIIIAPELHDALEDYSCKMEQLKNLIDFINDWVWEQVSIGNIEEGKTADKLRCLTENLSDLSHLHDSELSAILDNVRSPETATD